MTMSVMNEAPTSDQVAIWYSTRGRGVGCGVVVTAITTTNTPGLTSTRHGTAHATVDYCHWSQLNAMDFWKNATRVYDYSTFAARIGQRERVLDL